MKKLISVLLAILMVFSVVTVAFAADGDATQEPAATEESSANDFFNMIIKLIIGDGSIENVPLGTAKAGLKIAKIFAKLAKAFIKVGDALGFLDADKIFLDLVGKIEESVNNGGNDTPADPAPETPADPVNP